MITQLTKQLQEEKQEIIESLDDIEVEDVNIKKFKEKLWNLKNLRKLYKKENKY